MPPNLDVTFATIDPPSTTVTLPVTPLSFGSVDTASWTRAQPLQWSSQILDFAGNPSRSIALPALTFYAESLEESITLGQEIAKLRSFVYVPRQQTQLGGTNRPRRLLLIWSNLYREIVVLESVGVQRIAFFSDGGVGTRGAARGWTVQLKVVEFQTTRRSSEDVEVGSDGFGGELGIGRGLG